MKIISFNLDRTVTIQDTDVVQNEMVYKDTKQAHFLNTDLVGFIVYLPKLKKPKLPSPKSGY